MGLDKKPTPPPKRLKENEQEGSASPKNAYEMQTEEPSQAHGMQSQVQEQTSPEEDKVRDGMILQINECRMKALLPPK